MVANNLVVACILLAQVEDDYYIAHGHGGPFIVRMALMLTAWLCGVAACWVVTRR